MMEMEAGWYRDPAPANPAAPTTVRFWDGRQWTTQVKQASRQQRSEWRVEEMARQREYAASVQAAGGGYADGYGAVGRPSERDVTPDGVVLARWWSRFWAYSDKDLLQMFRPEYDRLAAEADAQRGLSL